MHNKTTADLDDFTTAYLECALWAENDESDERGGEPLDKNYGLEDFTPEALERAIEDCHRFQEENAADIAAGDNHPDYTASERAGHDFWLTRNEHGAGFWDGDWPEEAGARLTKAAKKVGVCYVSVGDDV